MRPQEFKPGDPHTLAVSLKARRISAQSNVQRTMDRLRRKYPGVPEEALREAYTVGYNSGHQARRTYRRDQGSGQRIA